MEGFRSFFMYRKDLLRQFALVVVLWVFAGIGVGIVGTLVMGCSCRSVMPQVVKAQNMVVDAQTTLAQTKALFAELAKQNIRLPEDKQAVLDKQIAAAEEGLRAALKVLDGAMDLCNEVDFVEAFKDFNAAWKIIRDILPFAAKVAPRFGITPVDGQPLIPDPVVFKLSTSQ